MPRSGQRSVGQVVRVAEEDRRGRVRKSGEVTCQGAGLRKTAGAPDATSLTHRRT